MAWATREQARAHWPDAGSLDDAVLDTLLEVATEQCAEYAPVLPLQLPLPDPLPDPPERYMLATVYQAREVYAAGQRDGDTIGLGEFVIRARPLTASVKSLLRPTAGVPRVG